MSCTALELRERKSNALLLFRDEPIQTFHKRIRPSSLKGRFQHGNNLRNYEDLPHTNLIILVQVLKQCFTALRSVRSVLIHRDICSFLRGVSSRFPSRLLEQRGTRRSEIPYAYAVFSIWPSLISNFSVNSSFCDLFLYG